MDETRTWGMIKTAVKGVNQLMKFLNDWRNFVDDDGSVNFLRQLKAYGAIHMLFADLQAINLTLDDHIRISLAFSLIDKLANLRLNLGNVRGRESTIAMHMAAESQGRELEAIFNRMIGTTRSPLCQSLVPLIRQCYSALHDHLREECPPGQNDEDKRLNRLRSSRNLSHGTFLNNEAFESLFLQSRGTVPKELLAVAFFLTWGLILDPRGFLSFDPQVGDQ
jgi:hypothetical protein